jgi:hypothetical protein
MIARSAATRLQPLVAHEYPDRAPLARRPLHNSDGEAALVGGDRRASAEPAAGWAVRRSGADLAHHLERLMAALLKAAVRDRAGRHTDFGQGRIHLALQLRRRPARRRPPHRPLSALLERATRFPAVLKGPARLSATVERAAWFLTRVKRPALPRAALFQIHFFFLAPRCPRTRTIQIGSRRKETKRRLPQELYHLLTAPWSALRASGRPTALKPWPERARQR